MLLFALILWPLIFATMLLPQALFGMCIAYRRRGPIHTDESGFPLLA